MTSNQERIINKMKELHECVLQESTKGAIIVISRNKKDCINLFYRVLPSGRTSLIREWRIK